MVYLDELKRHFSQIVFLTNEKKLNGGDLKYLAVNDFQIRYYKNEGFDFGMWYKAFIEFPVLDYDRIGLVNDSCILFKKLDFFFDWFNKNKVDYSGITDSSAIAYHIQSYFVVMNANAIKHVYEYFKEHKVKDDIKNVIHQYEVGLSTYLLSKNLKLDTFLKHENNCDQHNPMLFYSDDLIKKGMPMIKKKIIFSSFRKEEYISLMLMNFNINPRIHINLIKQVNGQEILFNFDQITKDIYTKKFLRRIVLYRIKSFVLRKLQKLGRYRTFNRINGAIGKYLYSGL
jgi:hypothetical protein